MRATPKAVTFTYSGRGRHVCKCCLEDIRAGDAVVMAATSATATWALHERCAEINNGVQTWREFFDLFAGEHYKRTMRRDQDQGATRPFSSP